MKRIFTFLFTAFLFTQVSGQLIINEVLYDPSNTALDGDANGDGTYDQEEDSFIEFVNIGTSNFDASGYQIWDDTVGGFLKFVVPTGTFVPPNGALVVFGGGTPTGDFGGAIVFTGDSANGLNLNNSGEVIVIKDNAGNTVLTFDSDALSNNPNESYTRFPDLTGAFIQHGDTTPILFSPGTRTDASPFDTLFVVESIVVSGMGGATTIDVNGGTLQMLADILPVFADDQSVTWSVPASNGIATINSNGLLTAIGNGSVDVTATSNDGTNITDMTTITISNQTVGLRNFNSSSSVSIIPNPAQNVISVVSENDILKVEVYNIQGKLLMSVVNSRNIDLSNLNSGNYFLKAHFKEGISTNRFIKD